MQTATIQDVYQSAKKNSQRIRHMTNESFPIGKWGRQGDIYIHRVNENHPHGIKTKNHQLAIGSTRGARHVAMSMDISDETSVEVFHGTKLPERAAENTFIGPFIKAIKKFKIYHPEHPHTILPPGCYQITHQRNMHQNIRQKD